MTKYVIIGGSVGAVGAVEAIREVDPIGDVIVISDEPKPAYSRPMIADYLSGEASLGKMFSLRYIRLGLKEYRLTIASLLGQAMGSPNGG